MNNQRFYGPASSCEELLKIGYTRNGFYLVKGNATSNNRHVEIIDCLFHHQGNRAKEGKKFTKVNIIKYNLTIQFADTISQGETVWTRYYDNQRNDQIPST